MTYKKSDGSAIIFTATSAVTAGVFYKIGNMVGLCTKTAAIGEMSSLETELFEYETSQIATAPAYVAGEKIYWDDTAALFTNVATGNTLVGVCTEGKAITVATFICFKRTSVLAI